MYTLGVMTSSSDLIRAARRELSGAPEATPRMRLAVVTCMDARIDPLRILGATVGDMHVIRNAGGIVTDDVIRSLTVSAVEFGTSRVHIIMHTDCGMHGLDEAGFRRRAMERTGAAPPGPMMGFDDVTAELIRGVERLRSSPCLSCVDRVSGSIYDVHAATLEPVVP